MSVGSQSVRSGVLHGGWTKAAIGAAFITSASALNPHGERILKADVMNAAPTPSFPMQKDDVHPILQQPYVRHAIRVPHVLPSAALHGRSQVQHAQRLGEFAQA